MKMVATSSRARERICWVPLIVDVEQDVAAGAQQRLDRWPGRPVEVAVHLGPFQQGAAVAQFPEPVLVDEVVVQTVDFAHPTGARRHRHR